MVRDIYAMLLGGVVGAIVGILFCLWIVKRNRLGFIMGFIDAYDKTVPPSNHLMIAYKDGYRLLDPPCDT